MHTNILLSIIISILLLSCQSVRNPDMVYVTNTHAVPLLAPSAVGTPLETYQLLTGSFGGREEFIAEAYVTADEDMLDIQVMSSAGQTMCSILWDGETLSFSSPFVSAAQIKAEYIVADMQFVLYDEKAVGQLIQDSGLVFSCENTDGMQSRVIYQGSEPVWSMEKTETHISVKNYLRNYSYDIEILMSSEIPTTE